MRQTLSLECSTKPSSNQSPQLQRLARELISLIIIQNIILYHMRITKELIRLRGCAALSALLLFANPPKTLKTYFGNQDSGTIKLSDIFGNLRELKPAMRAIYLEIVTLVTILLVIPQ